jgi:V/A-type H+-transporting ATPase subunit A
MMKVIGEEGTSLDDFIDYLKSEFFDFVYLQQNAFDEVDEATSAQRQRYIFNFIYENVLQRRFDFADKDSARQFFQKIRQLFRSWNSAKENTKDFKDTENQIREAIEAKTSKGP